MSAWLGFEPSTHGLRVKCNEPLYHKDQNNANHVTESSTHGIVMRISDYNHVQYIDPMCFRRRFDDMTTPLAVSTVISTQLISGKEKKINLIYPARYIYPFNLWVESGQCGVMSCKKT